MKKSEIKSLVATAKAAGCAAASACQPVAMVVREADVITGRALPGGRSYSVEGGVCGFAWIQVRPGNCAVANYLKANEGARKDSYFGGVALSVRDYGQSMQRKEAYATAFAQVLREAGVNAYMNSRMD